MKKIPIKIGYKMIYRKGVFVGVRKNKDDDFKNVDDLISEWYANLPMACFIVFFPLTLSIFAILLPFSFGLTAVLALLPVCGMWKLMEAIFPTYIQMEYGNNYIFIEQKIKENIRMTYSLAEFFKVFTVVDAPHEVKEIELNDLGIS